MKKIIFTLLFSTLVFSSPSYADWTKVSETVTGQVSYVDFDRIRKHDGYVHYWQLTNYLKPTKYGDLSAKLYYQGDCKAFRYRILTASFYTNSMGTGTISEEAQGSVSWDYPRPSSALETILNSVCSH